MSDKSLWTRKYQPTFVKITSENRVAKVVPNGYESPLRVDFSEYFRLCRGDRGREEKTVAQASTHHLLQGPLTQWKWVLFLCWACANGCATAPYRYGSFHTSREIRPAEVEIDNGKPNRILDGLAWTAGIWSRILTLNSHVNDHEFTDETREKLIAYMEENDLTDVLVRVNQYDPKGEWRRLRENRRISAGWKYSYGMITLLHYTLIPGRVFGGDEYNPFTNSLYINSDVAAVALHEAAYAKDVHSRRLPGPYAVLNEMPLLSLWRHTNGVNDVVSYAQTNDDWDVEHETYRVVYPQVGIHSTVMVGPLLPFWDGVILSVAGATAGHVTGQVAISQRNKQRASAAEERTGQEVSEPAETEQVHLQRRQTSSRSDGIQMTNLEKESIDDENP